PGQRGVAGVHGYRPAPVWPPDGITWQRPRSGPWQQDRRQGRRAVWPVVRLAQDPAGLWRRWMHSWMVRGGIIMRRWGSVAVGAGQCWQAATLAAAAMSWMNCPAKPRWPGWRRMRKIPHMMIPYSRPGTGPVVLPGEGRCSQRGRLVLRIGVARLVVIA